MKRFWQIFSQNLFLSLGSLILVIIFVVIAIGPYFYEGDFAQINLEQSNLSPSWDHPFGTNDLGQDQLARILIGGRISLSVALTSMIVAITLGTLIGAIAGFYGGLLDSLLMRFTDLCLSLPQLPLLLLIIYLFQDFVKAKLGPETGIFSLVVLVIGGLNWMTVAKLVRANFLKIKEMEFVLAAQAMGASSWRLIAGEILPNVLGIIVVAATLAVGNGIMIESTLSFLGLGFPPGIPTWGRMLFEARDYLSSAPHLAIFPGLAIFLTVFSVNSLGNGLRDVFDPKSR